MVEFLQANLGLAALITSVSLSIGIASILLGLSKRHVPPTAKGRPIVGVIIGIIFLCIAVLIITLVRHWTVIFILSILILSAIFTLMGYFAGLQARKNTLGRS